MKRVKVQEMTVSQLVEQFVEIALAQYDALDMGDTGEYNRLFDRMIDVMAEFLVRPVEQRRVLMTLYDHPNPQVRYTAAVATKDIAPQAARRVCEIISERNEYPQAADARGLIQALDQGKTDMRWILKAAKRNRPKT